ncbi:hypothetical protein ACLBOM_08615 [Escherichia coli]
MTTSAQDNITWDKNNRLSQGVTQNTDTLAGNGDVTLTAWSGYDVTGGIAVSSERPGPMAGHDVTLTGAHNLLAG